MNDKRRDKGDGSIYPTIRKTKNGEITYWVAKYKAPQMTKPKIKYGKSENEAKRLLRQMKHDAIKNDFIEVQKLSVKQYMNNWLNTVMVLQLKQKSFDTKEATLTNNVYPYVGDLQIASITPNDVQGMIKSLVDKGLSYSTTKKAYEAINACFKLGVIKGELLKNPCVGVSLPEKKRKKQSDIRFFSDDEIKTISKTSISKYGNGKPIYRLGHAIIFLLYTGLRIGEFLALTWDDIDFDNRSVTIAKSVSRVKNRDERIDKKYVRLHQDDTKTMSSERIVPLSDKAVKAAKSLQKLNGNFKYIACTSKGEIIHERAFDRMLRAILKRCGIEPCGVHVLRHTFASMLFRKNVDVKRVSELLGHKDVTITYNLYIHLIKEQKRQAIDLLDDL